MDLVEISEEAHRIIEEAQARLNALSRGEYNKTNKGKLRPGGALAAGAVLMAGEAAIAKGLSDEGGHGEGSAVAHADGGADA